MNPLEGRRFEFEAPTLTLVIRFFADKCGREVDELSGETRLDDLAVDSLDLVELVMAFEEEIGLKAGNRQLPIGKPETLRDLADWIDSGR